MTSNENNDQTQRGNKKRQRTTHFKSDKRLTAIIMRERKTKIRMWGWRREKWWVITVSVYQRGRHKCIAVQVVVRWSEGCWFDSPISSWSVIQQDIEPWWLGCQWVNVTSVGGGGCWINNKLTDLLRKCQWTCSFWCLFEFWYFTLIATVLYLIEY